MRLIDAEPILMRWNTELLGRKDMYDMVKNAPAIDIVRCKDCKWYEPPHILHDDGTKTYVDDGSLFVPASVGINVGGKCMNTLREYCLNHDREDPNDYECLVKFRERMDFCSDGERKEDEL